jgi:thymidylate kinase
MLLIEGSDCLGKTIFAKKIVRYVSNRGLPVSYGWMTRPNESLFDFFLDYKDLIHPYTVQDRLHFSGMAYHDNKISPVQLQIINSWIRSVGGIIVIFYASSEKFYEQRIRKDNRGNILSWPALCRANTFYKEYVQKGGDYDCAFDIISENEMYHNEQVSFVDDKWVEIIASDWIARRELLEK